MRLSRKPAETIAPLIKSSLKLLSLLLLATVSSAFGHSHPDSNTDCHTESPIKTYQANYSAQFSGLNINAVQKLEEIEPGIYRESLSAKNFIGKINEQSTFKLNKDQQLQPTEYSYRRSVFGRDRSERLHFDWENSTVEYKKDDKANSELELKVDYLDMIAHRLQLRRDLSAGERVFSYPVISRGKLKQYQYKVVSEQILDTAIGPLNTVKVVRVTDDDNKKVSVWLATDWDYLIVQLKQSEGKDGHQLKIRDAVIDDKKITPLAKIDETQL